MASDWAKNDAEETSEETNDRAIGLRSDVRIRMHSRTKDHTYVLEGVAAADLSSVALVGRAISSGENGGAGNDGEGKSKSSEFHREYSKGRESFV